MQNTPGRPSTDRTASPRTYIPADSIGALLDEIKQLIRDLSVTLKNEG